MAKNLWQKERNALFRDLVRQYSEEGYDQKEAKKLARQDFVDNLWSETYRDS